MLEIQEERPEHCPQPQTRPPKSCYFLDCKFCKWLFQLWSLEFCHTSRSSISFVLSSFIWPFSWRRGKVLFPQHIVWSTPGYLKLNCWISHLEFSTCLVGARESCCSTSWRYSVDTIVVVQCNKHRLFIVTLFIYLRFLRLEARAPHGELAFDLSCSTPRNGCSAHISFNTSCKLDKYLVDDCGQPQLRQEVDLLLCLSRAPSCTYWLINLIPSKRPVLLSPQKARHATF